MHYWTAIFIGLFLLVGFGLYTVVATYSESEYREYVSAIHSAEDVADKAVSKKCSKGDRSCRDYVYSKVFSSESADIHLVTWAGLGESIVTDRTPEGGLTEKTVLYWFCVIGSAFMLMMGIASFGVIQMIRSPAEESVS